MHQHFQSAQGVCPKCRGEGRVGQRCEHGACARDGIHYIPTRFAPQRGDERDPLLGHVVARHLLIERLQRRVIDTAYRALQIPALLEVELTLAAGDREPAVHDDLLRQAMALGRLGVHPNFTRLVLFGTDTAGTFLVTDSYAEAGTLADVVRPEGNDALPVAAARLLLEPLAAALGGLGQARLVHGEIRPEHVLVHEVSGYPAYVQLGGFVRLPAPDPDGHSAAALVWRTPEQISRHAVGGTTDVYAVAAIAFALLFGRPPFPSADRDDVLAAKRDPSFDPMKGLASAPPEVAHLFQTALAFEPTERFRVEGFSNALHAALDVLARQEDAPFMGSAATEVPPTAPRRPHLFGTAADREAPTVHEGPKASPLDGGEAKPVSHGARSTGTQELSTDELEELASRRAVPLYRGSKH